MKQMKTILLAGSVAFLLSACGGGSSSESSVAPVAPVPTGTAFYIDSTVSGVNYTCGSQEGITGIDGSFTFEVGTSCTFYLGDMKLRGVDAGLLVDGENVYEKDVNIAQILLSLDSDGNPDNGITISATAVQALGDADITSLPTDYTEMDEMLQVIEDNGGTYVIREDAQNHIDETEIKLLLIGNTFYSIYCDIIHGTINTIYTFTETAVKFSMEGNGYKYDEILPYMIEGGALVVNYVDNAGNATTCETTVDDKQIVSMTCETLFPTVDGSTLIVSRTLTLWESLEDAENNSDGC